MDEHILLAGCGDLGRRVAQQLLAQGHRITALRRRPDPSALPAAPTTLNWIAADLGSDTFPALPTDISRVVYLPAPGRRDAQRYTQLYEQGLPRLLAQLPAGLKRVVLVSSTSVYGNTGGDWVDESTPVAPDGRTSLALWRTEQWLASQTAIPSVALRLAGLYGPGRMHVFKRLLAHSDTEAPLAAQHWANRIHVDDAASAIVHLLFLPKPQALYIGADGHPFLLHELYAALAQACGRLTPPIAADTGRVEGRRLRNERLLASGLVLRWPDALEGYLAMMPQALANQSP